MRTIAIACGLMAAVAGGNGLARTGPGPAAVAMPAWMAGCWIDRKGAVWTEECWTSARGGVMIGSGRNGDGDRVKFWEAMQIIDESVHQPGGGAGAGLSLYAAPKGVDRTRFRARADGQPGVTFYNEQNDYPQRIRYWQDGAFLRAEIAMADGSKAQSWRFERM